MQIRSLLILPDIRENVLIENRLVLRGQVQTCRNRLIQNRFFGGTCFPEQVWQFFFVQNSSTRDSQLDEGDKLDDVGVRRWLVDSDVDEGVVSDAHNATLNEDESKTFLFRRKKIFSYLFFFSSQRSARPRWSKKCERGNGAFPECRTLSFFPRGGKNNSPSPFRQNFGRLLPLLFPPLLLNQGWRASHDRVNNNITRSKLRRCHQRCGKLYTA